VVGTLGPHAVSTAPSPYRVVVTKGASVPESRVRRKKKFTPESHAPEPVRFGSSAWWAPVMVGFFILGLLWIVVYYIAGADLPIMSALNWWNIVVGFGFIGVGFAMSTRWS
jgi:hypothetical protein